MGGEAAPAAADALRALLEEEDEDLTGFAEDAAVQEALSCGRDLREHAEEVESSLRAVERESIADYIKESESLAGLHTQIRECDGVLDTMESMLRGFQSDLASISAQIKYLQDESLSMNVRLRNRKAAETQLSSFITQIVVPPELISQICEAEVDASYLGYVQQLDAKVSFAKLESTAMTSACADIAPELEKLRLKSVQRIRDFLLERVGRLKRRMTNTQILQNSVLLKYKGLYAFLQSHAPDVCAEVREAYTTTMSSVYLAKVRDYLTGLLALKVEPPSKSDLLAAEEWVGYTSSLFSSKPSHARGDGAFKLGERRAVLDAAGEPPLVLPAAQQEGKPLHYEAIFRSACTLLLDVASSEHSFLTSFFGDADSFDHVFGKSIFFAMENLEQHLVTSWDAVGCLLLVHVNTAQRDAMAARPVPLLANFFARVQVLVWSRFKAIMEAHVQSVSAFMPSGKAPETTPHYVARRYAELVASLRSLKVASVQPMLGSILRVLWTEVEKLLSERLARQHPTLKHQAALLINNYDLVVHTLAERGARGEESTHFEQLLDQVKTVFVEEQLLADNGKMISFVKQAEPLLVPGAPPEDAAKVDKGAMEHLTREFYDKWKAGIEAIHRDVVQSFSNFKLGMDILKQVLTQLLLYYTRFLDLVKQAFPHGPPFAQYILSIPTLMNEIKHFSRNF